MNEDHRDSREDVIMFVKGNTIEVKTEKDGNFHKDNMPKESAINEETGEINWDCPCLKSALAPPCGNFFKEAFACFVASKTDPKGRDCLDKFTAMQECFRENPQIYMNDIDDDSKEV